MKLVAALMFALGLCGCALAAMDYAGPMNLSIFGGHIAIDISSDPHIALFGGILLIGGGALWIYSEHRRHSKAGIPKA
jgi:hypothetical protein